MGAGGHVQCCVMSLTRAMWCWRSVEEWELQDVGGDIHRHLDRGLRKTEGEGGSTNICLNSEDSLCSLRSFYLIKSLF